MRDPIDVFKDLLEKHEQTLDDLASYIVLCSDLKIENEKLRQRIKELETEQDVKDKRKTCLNCQMLRPTTDSKVKLCGSYFQKGSLFSQPTSIVFLENHCCQNHVSF